MNKFLVPTVLILVAFLSVFLFGVRSFHKAFELSGDETPLQFNDERWRKDTGEEFGDRSRMVDDLADSRILIGLTVEEVHKVIGEPELSMSIDDYDEYWNAGFELGKFHFDHAVLAVQYEDGVVVAADRLHIG